MSKAEKRNLTPFAFALSSAPVRGAILPAQIQHTCESIVSHVAEVSFQKFKINRMVLNFKVDADNQVWFQYASSLRCDGATPTVGGGGSASDSNSKTAKLGSINIDRTVSVPKHISLSSLKPVRRVTTSAPDSMSASLIAAEAAEFKAAVELRSKSKRTGTQQAAASLGLVDELAGRCVSCGVMLQEGYSGPVQYKVVIAHYDSVLKQLGVDPCMRADHPDDLAPSAVPPESQWPKERAAQSTAGGLGLFGVYKPKADGSKGPKVLAVSHIPPMLNLVHRNLTTGEYLRYKQDPLFQSKQAVVCEDCFLGYTRIHEALLSGNSANYALELVMGDNAIGRRRRQIHPHSVVEGARRARRLASEEAKRAESSLIGQRFTASASRIAPTSSMDNSTLGGPSFRAMSQSLSMPGLPSVQSGSMMANSSIAERDAGFASALAANPNLHKAHPLAHMVFNPAMAGYPTSSQPMSRPTDSSQEVPAFNLNSSATDALGESLIAKLPDKIESTAKLTRSAYGKTAMDIPEHPEERRRRKMRAKLRKKWLQREKERKALAASKLNAASSANNSGLAKPAAIADNHLEFLRQTIQDVRREMARPDSLAGLLGYTEDSAAIVLQALVRGGLARRRVRRLRQDMAAAAIQQVYRREADRLRDERHASDQIAGERALINGAATKIQSVVRGRQGRKAGKRRRQQVREQHAATSIQALVRGVQAREYLRGKNSRHGANLAYARELRESAAASRIAGLWREKHPYFKAGHLGEAHRARMIQRLWRETYPERNDLHKYAVGLIQRAYRGSKGRYAATLSLCRRLQADLRPLVAAKAWDTPANGLFIACALLGSPTQPAFATLSISYAASTAFNFVCQKMNLATKAFSREVMTLNSLCSDANPFLLDGAALFLDKANSEAVAAGHSRSAAFRAIHSPKCSRQVPRLSVGVVAAHVVKSCGQFFTYTLLANTPTLARGRDNCVFELRRFDHLSGRLSIQQLKGTELSSVQNPFVAGLHSPFEPSTAAAGSGAGAAAEAGAPLVDDIVLSRWQSVELKQAVRRHPLALTARETSIFLLHLSKNEDTRLEMTSLDCSSGGQTARPVSRDAAFKSALLASMVPLGGVLPDDPEPDPEAERRQQEEEARIAADPKLRLQIDIAQLTTDQLSAFAKAKPSQPQATTLAAVCVLLGQNATLAQAQRLVVADDLKERLLAATPRNIPPARLALACRLCDKGVVIESGSRTGPSWVPVVLLRWVRMLTDDTSSSVAQSDAARRIQATVRDRNARLMVAISIQRLYRGWKGRERFNAIYSERERLSKSRRNAAIQIQRIARSVAARVRVAALRAKTPPKLDTVAEIMRALLGLTEAQLHSFTRLADPPESAIRVIGAIAVILGEEPKWKIAVSVILASSFKSRLAAVEPAAISSATAAVGRKLVHGVNFIADDGFVQPELMTAHVLLAWCRYVLGMQITAVGATVQHDAPVDVEMRTLQGLDLVAVAHFIASPEPSRAAMRAGAALAVLLNRPLTWRSIVTILTSPTTLEQAANLKGITTLQQQQQAYHLIRPLAKSDTLGPVAAADMAVSAGPPEVRQVIATIVNHVTTHLHDVGCVDTPGRRPTITLRLDRLDCSVQVTPVEEAELSFGRGPDDSRDMEPPLSPVQRERDGMHAAVGEAVVSADEDRIGIALIRAEDVAELAAVQPAVAALKVLGALCVVMGMESTLTTGVQFLQTESFKVSLLFFDMSTVERKSMAVAARLLEDVQLPDSDDFVAAHMRPIVALGRWLRQRVADALSALDHSSDVMSTRVRRVVPVFEPEDVADFVAARRAPPDVLRVVGAVRNNDPIGFFQLHTATAHCRFESSFTQHPATAPKVMPLMFVVCSFCRSVFFSATRLLGQKGWHWYKHRISAASWRRQTFMLFPYANITPSYCAISSHIVRVVPHPKATLCHALVVVWRNLLHTLLCCCVYPLHTAPLTGNRLKIVPCGAA